MNIYMEPYLHLYFFLIATPNFPTNIVYFRGLSSSVPNLNSKGWNSQAHKGFPGKFESSNASRDNLSRDIGRILANIFKFNI